MRRVLPKEASASQLKFVLALQGAALAAFCLVAVSPDATQSLRSPSTTGLNGEPAPQNGAEKGLPSDLQREQMRLSNFADLDERDLTPPLPSPEAPDAPTMLKLAAFHSNAVALSAPLMVSQLAANTNANVPTRLVAYSLAKGDGGMFSRAGRSRAGRRVGSGGGPGAGPPIGGIGGRGRGGAGGGGGGNCPGSGGR